MSAKDFKFVSPGVFIEEIDNSQLPKSPIAIGPLVVGRARRGPAYQPVRVDSFSEFVSIFGNPVAGDEASDVWRSGIPKAPTFAAYAAQAWLKNSSPLTFIRLLGDQSPDAATGGEAGWLSSAPTNGGGGGAYGLFLFNSSSAAPEVVGGTLAAVLYTTEGGFALSGAIRGTKSTDAHSMDVTHITASAAIVQSNASGDFTFQVYDQGRNLSEEAVINFTRTSNNYVRKILNTDPTLTNAVLVDSTAANSKKYWLGQTFERQVKDTITNYGSNVCYAALLRLGRAGTDVLNAGNYNFGTKHARSGWFFSQDLRTTPAKGSNELSDNTLAPNIYDPASLSGVTRLFKIHTISGGEDEHRSYKISIENLKYSKNDNAPYGSFTLAIRDAKDSDNSKTYIERYTNLSLDPSSQNYIAKQIGDKYYEWDTNQRRLMEYGSYDNRSRIVRVEMSNAVDQGQTDPELLPFGVEGPIKFNDFTVVNVAEETAATGSLTVRQSGFDVANFNLQRMVITDTAGNAVNYEFTSNATGSATGTVIEGHTMIRITGLGVIGTVNEIRTAINDTQGNNGGSADSKIVIGANGGSGGDDIQLPLTQAIKGTGGNVDITKTMVDSVMLPVGMQGAVGDLTTNAFLSNGSGADPQSPVSAGSGSANAAFMAPTSSGGNTTELQAQFAGRSEGSIAFTGSVSFPAVALRLSASDGDLNDPTNAYFGAQYNRAANDSTFEDSVIDLLYPVADSNGGYSASTTLAGGLVTSWYFSLDDLMMKQTANEATTPIIYYDSGSRARGDSITARSGSYKNVLDKGYDRFTSPLYGGFNGFDITEKEPFNDSRALETGATETSKAMYYSVKKGIDMFSDPEFIEANILAIPGVVNEPLTTHMIETCESRGDAMALIDPRGGYLPASENSDPEKERITSTVGLAGVSGHVKEVADNLELRNLNSSYGAAYYPWVRIVDSISGQDIWAPPSIAAFGAMSFSENESALWFAPAGFNRGGLTGGAAGIPVTNVRNRLTSAERDYLYERNINPIATFPNEGIVIFGQKTLQVTPSALDRINVRRLMIFVKKEISRIASTLLFDQNVEQTWARFTSQVSPFLDNIKNNFGLDDFRVVLDETTTTPDLVDRNTVYAKIFLKPTRAIEFFAIDFVITNSGASFED